MGEFLSPQATQQLPEDLCGNIVPLVEANIEAIVSRVVDRLMEVLAAKERQIDQKVADALQDISYRIGVLDDIRKSIFGEDHRMTSRDLNLAHHILDGYQFTDNSPSAGYVAWTDCHVVYQGNDHAITNSNTNQKFIYWLAATPSAFQVTNTKPTLGASDCLVVINENGKATNVMANGKFQSGAMLSDGTVGSGEIGSGAITSAKIAASAIFGTHISPSAIASAHINDGAVVSGKIANGAVVSAKIAASAVNTSHVADSAVSSAKIATGAVISTKIADGNIISSKIADGHIISAKIASSAVGSAHIGSSAVGTGHIANSAITGAKIGAGQVATDKLNLATHLLY